MPTENCTIYKIFVSCPSDVNEERDALIREITRYNNGPFATKNTRIEVVHGEQVPPRMGKDPQQHINDIIGEYDIYIGIMGERFGSPTVEYSSGTEEEYQIALQRIKSDPDKICGAFFFKQSGINDNVTDEELEQFIKKRDFIKKIQLEREGLYKTFKNSTEFCNNAMDVISTFIKQHKDIETKHQSSLHVDLPISTAYQINPHFLEEWVTNLEADGLSNGVVKEIKLQDIFVFPDLRELNQEKKSETNFRSDGHISSEDLFQSGKEPFKWLLLGDEKVGKSALCKMAFSTFHKLDYVPILITGEDIKNSTAHSIKTKLRSAFAEQYSEQNLPLFNTLPAKKIVVIIDDIHSCKLNIKHKTRVLRLIAEDYPNIICTGSMIFHIDATTSAQSEYRELHNFEKYQIKDAGHRIRWKLARKWHSLGAEEYIQEEELQHRTETSLNTIDNLLSNNFMACTPFVVLVLLQATEAGSAQNLTDGSFVRYYQHLIYTQLLRKAPKDTIELIFNFLPTVAFIMLQAKEKRIHQNDFDQLFRNFIHQKAISKSDELRLYEATTNGGLLVLKEQEYSFKQPYTYYFFLAEYLHNNSSKPDIRKLVTDLCDQLHLRDNSNILIFLSYRTNDELILERILNLANSIFSENAPFEFNRDTDAPINRLVHVAPSLLVDHENAEKVREKDLARRDVLKDNLPKKEEEIEHECIDELSFSAQLNLTFKIARIAGQLLKNHHVNLDRERKEEICITVYTLMLRCLNILIESFSNNLDTLITEVKSIDPDIETEEDAHKAVFKLASFVTFAFFKTTARFVGAEKLEEIYNGIARANDNSTAIETINLAIKLDFFKDLPISEIRESAHSLRNNPLGQFCLRLLVHNRMYVRPISEHNIRQQICDAVGLDYQRQVISTAKEITKQKEKII